VSAHSDGAEDRTTA